MKAYKAFYKTLKSIMSGANIIFSLGFDKYVSNILLIPLYLLGKLGKYLIGFPLGLILGGLAALAVSIFNLFTGEEKQNKVEEESSDEEYSEEEYSEEESYDFVEDSDDFQYESVEEVQNQEPVVIVKNNPVENKFEQSVFLNKKSKFETKVNLLIQFIDEQIRLLNPNYEKYKAVQARCSSLTSDLFYERSAAETAQKFSHYITEIETKVSCPCGMCYGYVCNNCKMPVATIEIEHATPFFVADEDKRKQAKEKSVLIESALQSESNKLITYEADYEKCCALKKIISHLESFVPCFEKLKTELTLCMILAEYDKILIELQKIFSEQKEFNINNFLPRSEYSQLFVASKMIKQINKYNGFFQALPEELKTKIAVSTVSSDFAEEEARDFYLSCV